jgi:hypothetical protein
MKKALLATTAIISLLAVSSCGKYEEGPGVSLLTKKARLTGVWDVKEYVSGSTTVTDNSDDTFEIIKDGTYKYTSGSTSTEGTWEFTGDKEKLKTTYSYTVFGTTYTEANEVTIIRLTNTELWTKDADGDITKAEKI